MKMKYLALLAAVVVLLGAIFFVAPDAKAAEHGCTGSHCLCAGKTIESAEGKAAHGECSDIAMDPVDDESDIDWENGGNYYLTCDVALTTNITVSDNVSICLNGYTLSYTVEYNKGSGVGFSVSGTFNVTDCGTTGKIICTNGSLRNLFQTLTGTLNLYSGTLEYGGNKGLGSSIINTYTGVFNMYGGALYRDTTATTQGSCFKPGKNSKTNIYGGEIYGVGVVYTETDSAGRGRGGLIYSKQTTAVMNIHGGKIHGGSASAFDSSEGGNIYFAGKLTITGGEISGGTATNGADVYITSDGSLTLSGNPVIGELCSAGTKNQTAIEAFADGKANYSVTTDDNVVLTWIDAEAHKHCFCNGKATDHGDCDEIEWTPVGTAEEFVAAYKGGCYIYLTDSIDLGTTTLSGYKGERTICLNGHELKSSYSSGFIAGTMSSAGTLNITDCQYNGTTGGTLDSRISLRTSATLNVYGGILTNTSGTEVVNQSDFYNGNIFNLYNGTVRGGEGKRAVYVGEDNTFNMYGGVVTGGTADEGGNIFAVGDVNISGGTISDGTATEAGGNIWIAGDLTISGTALIKDGTSHNGGNIYTEGNVTISGGTIQDGTATGSYGGNIQVAGPKSTADVTNYVTFTMTAGTITRGTVNVYNGGNIAFAGVMATISGGTISDGKRIGTEEKTYCGGANISLRSGTLEITGTAIISGGNSSYNGGNIVVRYTEEYLPTKLLITGGTISDGVAANTGGNIHVYSAPSAAYTPEVEITGGTIFGGSAVRGGALYVNDTMNNNVVIKNCTIKGNISTGEETGAIDLRGATGATLGGVLVFEGNGVDIALRTANTKISVAEITNNPTIKLSVRSAYVFTTDEGNVTFEPATERWTFEKITEGENAGFWQSIDHLIFTIGDTEYYNVEDALTAIQGGGVIVIQKDGVAFTLSVNAIVDLNGKNCTITLTNGVVLNIYDAYANNYEVAKMGKVFINGNGTVNNLYSLVGSNGTTRRYIKIQNEDGSYSFHRFHVTITYYGVNPGYNGIGVKATFAGTKAAMEMIKAGKYGVIGSSDPTVSYGTVGTVIPDMTNGNFIQDGEAYVYTASFIMADAYTGDVTETKYFRAYIDFGGEYGAVESKVVVPINPKAMLELIDTNWNATTGEGENAAPYYTDDQKQAIADMVNDLQAGNVDFRTQFEGGLANIPERTESNANMSAAIPVAKKFGFNI